ncbi:MAG TPA: homoserine kinase [Casimicrobiaceae bacterium]|nr:homoserine kinase [Casimicrobiaceae bacterium]
MSVYTTVSAEELDAWLGRYGLGALVAHEPIKAGIENTNYFVTTERGRYVLTLYERLPANELPFYLNLMAHLAKAGVPVPAPAADRTGALFSMLCGKPASLVDRIDGVAHLSPTVADCAAIGASLAQLHVAAQTYRGRLANRRGPAWWRQAARAVRPFLGPAQAEMLASELRFQAGLNRMRLPRAAIHGDLFRDNVLFAGGRVAGIIDFGFAATDFLAYDLAIAVNDWCNLPDCELDAGRMRAFIEGYESHRPLTPDERDQWSTLLRAAALRFWLSRLYDLYLPRPGELVHAHDPTVYERILAHRIATVPALPRARAA